MLLVGIICLIITGLSWVIIGAFVGGAERHGISNPLLLVFLGLTSILIGGVVLHFSPDPVIPWKSRLFYGMMYLGSGFFDALMLVVMGWAMKKGPNGVVWTVTQSGTLLTFLFGVIFCGVSLTLWRGLGILAILATLWLYSRQKKAAAPQHSGGYDWRLLMLICFVLCGTNQILSNQPSYYEEARESFSISSRIVWANIGQIMGSLLFIGPQLFHAHFWEDTKRPLFWKYLLIWESSSLLVVYGLQYPGLDNVSKNGAGAICYPVMVCACILGFTAYSIVSLHEKCNRNQILALLSGVVGIVLISL